MCTFDDGRWLLLWLLLFHWLLQVAVGVVAVVIVGEPVRVGCRISIVVSFAESVVPGMGQIRRR